MVDKISGDLSKFCSESDINDQLAYAKNQLDKTTARACTFLAMLAGAQTPALASAQINPLTRAGRSSSRVGNAMETYMYIGAGALLLIILLVIFIL